LSHRGLHIVDWALLVIYAVGMVAIGLFYSRRQSNALHYFLGGGRMSPWVIGISLFATLFSTISYLSMPGEMIKNGPTYLFIFAAIPFSYVAVGHFLIPAFMQQRVISAYELLEVRLGSSVRTLGAMLFITLRLVWMTVLLYMAASAITIIIGLPPEQIGYVVFVTGIVTVLYTTLGGMRAVTVSDVALSLILLMGALATLIVTTWRLGGLSWFPTEWNPQWDRQPLFSFDPRVRVSVIGVILMNFLWQLCTAGGDQLAIQRYMSTRNAASAKRAFLIHSIASVVVSLLVCSIGFALMGYYGRFSQRLPPGETTASYADKLFPLFIANELPPGVSGLVVAALFAAAMSSLDSGMNSITAVVFRDVIERGRAPLEAGLRLARAQQLALIIGAIVVLMATQIGRIPGTFLELTKKTTNLFAAPIFGLFFLALFVRQADSFGAIIGTIYGCAAAVVVAYWDVLVGGEPVSFMWILPSSLFVQLGVAWSLSTIVSFTARRRRAAWAVSLLPLAAALGAFWVAHPQFK
jgi:solute:Na+ symporter, SSS family